MQGVMCWAVLWCSRNSHHVHAGHARAGAGTGRVRWVRRAHRRSGRPCAVSAVRCALRAVSAALPESQTHHHARSLSGTALIAPRRPHAWGTAAFPWAVWPAWAQRVATASPITRLPDQRCRRRPGHDRTLPFPLASRCARRHPCCARAVLVLCSLQQKHCRPQPRRRPSDRLQLPLLSLHPTLCSTGFSCGAVISHVVTSHLPGNQRC